MATTLYFRDANIALGNATIANPKLIRMDRGTSATSIAVTTISGTGVFIPVSSWTSPPLRTFTLSASITANLRAAESNAQANAGLYLELYRYVWATSTRDASPFSTFTTVEMGTAESALSVTSTPTSTTFANGDYIVALLYVANVGTMGSGRTATFYYDGPTAAASGDSYLTFTDNFEMQRRTTSTR